MIKSNLFYRICFKIAILVLSLRKQLKKVTTLILCHGNPNEIKCIIPSKTLKKLNVNPYPNRILSIYLSWITRFGLFL